MMKIMFAEHILKFWDRIESSSCVQTKEWVGNTPQNVLQIHMILRASKTARWIITRIVFLNYFTQMIAT